MEVGLINSLVLLGIAAFNAASAYMAYRALQQSKTNGDLILTVEKATNSMKDALVASASKEGFREGVKSATEVEVAISKIVPEGAAPPNVKVKATDKPS